MKGIIEDLNWRYATKQFDPKKKVSEKDLDELLKVLNLSPSSFGLQPWKFIVVTDQELRERLREAAWNQPQVTDASHLIVLCVRTNVDEKHIKKYIQDMAKTRNVTVNSLKDYEGSMTGSIKRKDKEGRSSGNFGLINPETIEYWRGFEIPEFEFES